MKNLAAKVARILDKDPFMPVYMAVVCALRDEISSCRIPAGTHLKEVETAKAAEVSRTTVRRAFDVLVLEGTVVRHYPQGIEVAGMVKSSYAEAAELRQMVDSFAGRLAAVRRSEKELKTMAEAIETLRKSEIIDDMTEADIAFHKAIYRAAGNSRIEEIAAKYDLDFTHAKYMSAKGVIPIRDRIVAEHDEIYQAIRNKDSQKAFVASLLHAGILFDPQLIGEAFPKAESKADQ